tara:strand:- start:174 stop:512 length:339 start_codon:yes stop_codon:yes gene_type:complete
MDVKQRYTGVEVEFEFDDFFVESLQELDLYTALKIGRYIKTNLQSLPKNEYTSYILGGVVVDTIGEPITFALEIINTKIEPTTLTDVSLITMDEYLDFINLNCYIKNSKKIG